MPYFGRIPFLFFLIKLFLLGKEKVWKENENGKRDGLHFSSGDGHGYTSLNWSTSLM
jgi:hypothetical protein